MNSLFELQPILIGKLLRLRPLKAHEFDALFVVASDPLIWELHPEKERYKKEVFEVYFKGAIESGGALVVEDLRAGKIIGCSRFYEFKQDSSEIFIGYTFLARDFWGGEYNREMKKLMLDHVQVCRLSSFSSGQSKSSFAWSDDKNWRKADSRRKFGWKISRDLRDQSSEFHHKFLLERWLTQGNGLAFRSGGWRRRR